MIIEALLNLLKVVLLFLIGLFPALPDMSGLISFFDSVFQLYLNVDSFVSVQLVGICIVLIFLFSNIEVIWGIVMWVVKKIPGVE